MVCLNYLSQSLHLVKRKAFKLFFNRTGQINTFAAISAVALGLCLLFLLVNKIFYLLTSPEDVGDGFSFSGCLNDAVADDLLYQGSDDEIKLGNDEVAEIPPKIVHYIWPNDKTFTFRNYLSVISVARFVQPSKIVFHFYLDGWWPFCGNCKTEPKPDSNRYNHWWEEVRLRIPNLVVKRDLWWPLGDGQKTIKDILSTHGGLYLREDVVFIRAFPIAKLRVKLSGEGSAFLGATISPNTAGEPAALALAYSHPHPINREIKAGGYYCSNDNTESFSDSMEIPCYYAGNEIYPHQFWTASGKFAEVVRYLAYGKTHHLQAVPSKDTKIPLICHYISVGANELDFTTFLSILSCLYILKAQVMIHGDQTPTGHHWEKLLRTTNHKGIRFLQRPLPETVFGKAVAHPSHVSDVWRVDILLKFGGIYSDWDVMWVNPVDDLVHYEAVASVDVMDWSPYPDVLNLGAFMAQKNAPYLRHLKKSMRFYQENGKFPLSYFYNACLIPYKVYECHPNLLHMERRLQAICNRGRCHPTWKDGYKNDDLDYPIDWRNGEAKSIHWTYPTLEEFESMEKLKAANNATFLAQIANYVLNSANVSW